MANIHKEIQCITNEWIDIIYLYDNNVKRKANGDCGTYIYEDNILKINWEKWGTEIFKNINHIYYNIPNDSFTIHLENKDWNDVGIFYIYENKIIRKYYPNEYGTYSFNKNDLIIEWKNWGKETFYGLNYGKYYNNTNFGNMMKNSTKKHIKTIAILFPQFHEIPENNNFWGSGFTEWTLLKDIPYKVNDEKIRKPHQDIGYYNLTDYHHRKYISTLMDKYNIYGLCFYHYWFKDRKVMYKPSELMLEDGEPNKPFFFCWANEQWTRRWDGGNNEILIHQEYGDENDNIKHYYYLNTFFKNKNYIKRYNKPIFIFYRIEDKDVNNIKKIISLWNNLAIKEGFNGIHFMRFLGPFNNDIMIDEIKGFVQFAPGYFNQKYFKDLCIEDQHKIFENYDENIYLNKNSDIKELVDKEILNSGYDHYMMIDENEKKVRTSKFFIYDGPKLYDKIIENKKIYEEEHHGISLNWNNTPRRNYTSNDYSKYPHYYKNINSTLFGETFYKLLNKINNEQNESDDFIFVSAWNEWNEQAILEPNNIDGYDYLDQINKKYLEFYNFPKKKNILNISHYGGGTEKYMNNIKNIFREYHFIDFDKFDIKINYDYFYENLDLIHINSILFNNLMNNYDFFFNNYFKNIKKYLTIHDYQWLYPDNPNILKNVFLSKPPCDNNIEKFKNLLDKIDKIIFPSKNIYSNYHYYINLNNYKDKIFIVNHCDKIIDNTFLYIPTIENNNINIAYVSHFIHYKGSDVFKKMANLNKKYKEYNIIYHLFGTFDSNLNNDIYYHDKYNDDTIINELHKNNIHGIVHLSLFEESYCFALTNSINSGLPILYLNNGAFYERLGENDKYFKCDSEDNLENIFNKYLDYIIDHQKSEIFESLNNNIQPNRWYLENY